MHKEAHGCDPGYRSGALASISKESYDVIAWERTKDNRSLKAVRWHFSHLPAIIRETHGWLVMPNVTELYGVAGLHPVNCAPCVVEGMFQSKRKGLIKLFESAGECVAFFREHYCEPLRPTGSKWRKEVLRLPSTMKAKECEGRAITFCLRSGLLTQNALDWLGTDVKRGAAAEALVMAVYAAKKGRVEWR